MNESNRDLNAHPTDEAGNELKAVRKNRLLFLSLRLQPHRFCLTFNQNLLIFLY